MRKGQRIFHGRVGLSPIRFTEKSVRRYLFVRLSIPVCPHNFFDKRKVQCRIVQKCSAALYNSVVRHYTIHFKLKDSGRTGESGQIDSCPLAELLQSVEE